MKKAQAREATYLELLEQATWWRMNNGEPIKLHKMGNAHRLNTIALLERRAAELVKRHQIHLLQTVIGHTWLVTSQEARNHVNVVLGRAQAAVDRPLDWMRDRPLTQELMRLCAQEYGLDPKHLHPLPASYDPDAPEWLTSEPEGVGAIVRDENGKEWVSSRGASGVMQWRFVTGSLRFDWLSLPPCTLVREGWTG